VAVGVGSRGIANLPGLVRGTVQGLRERGFEPFVFPAMGSHGGATARGQREQLASLGVTEAAIGCEIRSSMETVELGRAPTRDVPVYADVHAADADAVVPINRVKPHTSFVGDVESGLAKMLVVGVGNQRGAKAVHEWAVDWSLSDMIPSLAAVVLKRLQVAGGIAVVENQAHDTAIVEGVPSGDLIEREAALLETARGLLARLPWDDLDVLVIDRMGKDVSGTGMDTNVIGRLPHFYEPAPETASIKRIFVRSLTNGSHGNATGVGNADFVHQAVFDAWDPEASIVNGLTGSSVSLQCLPPVVQSDRTGLIAAFSTIGARRRGPESVRLVRASDTQHLRRFYASRALVETVHKRENLAVVREPEPLQFEDGAFSVPPADRLDI